MIRRRPLLTAGAALGLVGAGGAIAISRRMGSMRDYDASVAESRSAMAAAPEISALVRYATLAPSGHNTQPWRFRIRAEGVDILPDFARRTPVVDPDDHHLFVGLGCAAENLAIAAAAHGRPGNCRFDPAQDGSIAFAFGPGQAGEPSLFDAIARRQSTRADYDGRQVDAADLERMAAAASVPSVDVAVITDRPRMARVRDLVVAGNGAQMADPAFVRELRTWLRFSPREALAAGDGLFSATSGNPVLPAWLGPHLFDWTFNAAAENDKYARQIASSSGVAVFLAARADPEHWVRAGRACQRFALQATALGLKLAFINQPVEVAGLRPELAALAGLPGRRPDLVMRFGYGPAMPFSARRTIAAVLA